MAALQAERSKMHDDMAGLSTQGINRVVPGATHYIHHDRPQVVIDAINEVIGAAIRARADTVQGSARAADRREPRYPPQVIATRQKRSRSFADEWNT
jgi:LPS sulfotransferase NodH